MNLNKDFIKTIKYLLDDEFNIINFNKYTYYLNT